MRVLIQSLVLLGVAAPLLTLMGGGSVELAFTVLAHIQLLVERAPGVFDDQFKHFFCRSATRFRFCSFIGFSC